MTIFCLFIVGGFRTLKQDIKKTMGQIFPVHEVARMNFSTRFSNSSGNFKPFGKKNRRNPSIFSPKINGWSLVEKRVRKLDKVDKIPVSGPILMIFFLNRLNFSRRTRKSGWKIHGNNAKWLNSKPASLKNVTYIIGEFVCFTMQVSQLVWISFLKVKFLNSVKLPFLDRFEKFFKTDLNDLKVTFYVFCKKSQQTPFSFQHSRGSSFSSGQFSLKALPGFEPGISCLLDRRFNR